MKITLKSITDALFENEKIQLIQLSFLMLFVELALIRWLGSNILYLSYFSNFVLLGSFLGIGIGFIRSQSSVNLFQWTPILLALLILIVFLFPVRINRAGAELIYFGTDFNNNPETKLPIWLVLPVIFLIVTFVMAAIADGVARCFRKFPPLEAYRLDILGSILGIAIFSLFSFLDTTPLWWGITVSLILFILYKKNWRLSNSMTLLQLASLCMIIAALGNESILPNFLWSPYYKINLLQDNKGTYIVAVNGIPQQSMLSLENKLHWKGPYSYYLLPYEHQKQHHVLENVLIVGAGTGSDISIALAAGAQHIDAVEIDPLLYYVGKRLHPDQPYANPRVDVHINDGRAFLEKNNILYDMILFALPDSLTLVSGQSSLRLENYLFTLEAIQAASRHLKPNGVFTMYNYYRENWLVDRFTNTLTNVFKQAPCLDTFGAKTSWLSVYTISKNPAVLQCPSHGTYTNDTYAAPSTDNHPFIYLKYNRIPILYFYTLIFILFAALCAIKLIGVSYSSLRTNTDLFFMGAAFLLLETKNIVNFALLFGTTWFVNALVFAGILLVVYLAIEVTNHIKLPRPIILYALLFLSLFIAWLIPVSALLSFSGTARFAIATMIAFAPIFFANLIFAERFRKTSNSVEAFGINLFGAMTGGILEYVSLIIGYRSLIIVVAFLYVLAILTSNIKLQQSTE